MRRSLLRVYLPAIGIGVLAELIAGAVFGVAGAALVAVGFCTTFAATYILRDLADI